MASPATIAFTDGSSGKIYWTSLGGYVAYTGSSSVSYSGNPSTGAYERGFLNFDTSVIGAGATVTMVEIYVINNIVQPSVGPTTSYMYIGQFIEGSLDGNVGEWNGGSLIWVVLSFTRANFPDGWKDLSEGGYGDATGYVDVTGETDIRFYGTRGDKTAWGQNLNQVKDKCKLRVTYTVPVSGKRRTLMGVGLEFLGMLWVNGVLHYKFRQTFNPMGV